MSLRDVQDALSAVLLTAWIGSLWAIGYLAVPVLFHAQPDRQLAGWLAGEMFTVSGYLGLICGGYLLLQQRHFVRSRTTSRTFWLIVALLLLTLLQQFAIHPFMAEMKTQVAPQDILHSPLAGRFKLWHGISSVLYLLQSLLGAWLVTRWRREN